jgi:putative polyketide hydroxylase
MHPLASSNNRVLIAGAGPAGLTAAITLARYGVATLVIERRHQLSSLPRATVVSTRSMEIFRAFGLEPALLAGAADVDWKMLSVRTLAEAADGVPIDVGLPSRDQAAVISPTAPSCVAQDHLEPVLLEHLRSLGGAVRLGCEITGVAAQPGGVRVTVRDADSGATETMTGRYLVGADGARSVVRSALGISMHGPDNLMGATSTLFRAAVWPVVGERRFGIYDVTHPGGPATVLPAGRGDRWVLGSLHPIGQGPPLDADSAASRIRLAVGAARLDVEIMRSGRFTFAAQLAERFRQGRVFLAGDAAHRVTPRGGTGMNTAVHDGYDIGWKLGWVLNGWAPASLLDSYEEERRPVAEHNVTRSANPTGTRRAAVSELHADLGGRIPHLRVAGPQGPRSTLDLLGRGLTVFTAEGAERTVPAAGAAPVTMRPLDALTARALGLHGSASLVVRPDGVPVATAGAAASVAA